MKNTYHMCLDIWPRGHVRTQSCSDPRPANTHVIKTDVALMKYPPRPLVRPRHDENAPRHGCATVQLQDTELMIRCPVQSF